MSPYRVTVKTRHEHYEEVVVYQAPLWRWVLIAGLFLFSIACFVMTAVLLLSSL